MGKVTLVQCPTCRRRGDWMAAQWGPFCSRRCKLVDLGKWFNEEHAIADPLKPEHLEELADLPPAALDDRDSAGK